MREQTYVERQMGNAFVMGFGCGLLFALLGVAIMRVIR